uniref:Uncharacterized protein n=1 Tax=Tanacetum cinerariifolium TaxID=118510 RepID=A0A6L2LIP1_TANCI|nr:hypothetical protein [Tanacetum cinerariifolium]
MSQEQSQMCRLQMSSSPYQSQPSQHFSPVNLFALDDEFKSLVEYALGQGSGGFQDNSPIVEVAPDKRLTTTITWSGDNERGF